MATGGTPKRGSISTKDGFHDKVLSALQLAKIELESRGEKANFIRIIMRFNKIKAVFDRLKAIHARCDTSGDGVVDTEELISAMTDLFNEGRAEGRVGCGWGLGFRLCLAISLRRN